MLLIAHNGEFVGAASFMGVLPGRNVAVGVMLNGPRQGVMLAELVAADALAAALGDSLPDVLDRYGAMAARFAGGQRVPPNTGRLTLPAHAYAGRYAHPDWGTLEVSARGDSITARLGVMPVRMVLAGDDRVGGEYPGVFEKDGRGRVGAIWLRMSGADSVRFARPQ